MKTKRQERRKLRPSSYTLLSDLAELDRVRDDIPEEEADRRAEELIARLDAIALKDPKEATAVYQQSKYFDEAIAEDELYLSFGYRITRAQLSELNTPEKRAAYIAEQDRAFNEAYNTGKHIITDCRGFTVLED